MRKSLLLVLFLSVSIPYAAAHPFTLETSPSSAFNAPVGITEISVIYSEPIELDFSSLKIFDNGGNQIDNKDTKYYDDEASLLVSTPPLPEGIYTVQSKVLSKVDGHLVPDAFVFAVGDIKLDRSHLEPTQNTVIFLPEAGARFPGLVGQTILLGAVIASLLIWGTQNKQLIRSELEKLNFTYHGKFMSLIGVGLVLVVASNIVMLVVQTIRLETSVIDVIQTTFGMTWLFRMIITVILFGIWFWVDRKNHLTIFNQIPILVTSLVLIGTTTIMGHGAASEQPLAILLDYMHNLVAAIWIGGIIFFAFVLLPTFSKLDEIKRERMSLVMIPRFSIAFVIAIGLVIITGPTLMWLLESDVGMITESTYGKLIMIKIAIASIMIGLGALFQFKIQKSGEKSLDETILVHKPLRRSLKIDVILGVILLGVVALLVNGTLPAGEIQQIDAQEIAYGFRVVEFSENAKFDVLIEPFDRGNNTLDVMISNLDDMQLDDFDGLKVKVSNPQKNITPIEVPLESVTNEDGISQFTGELTFGFSGQWQVDIEIQRLQSANEAISLNLPVKPRLADIRVNMIEYELPETAKPLYPLFDEKDSIWISDPSAPKLWKFDLNSKNFESFSFDGVATMWLTKDPDGKIWFTDTPRNQIGFLDPNTNEITTINLPEIQPVIYQNTPTFIQSDFEGNIWIAITNKGTIIRYEQNQETFKEVRFADRESLPFALAVDEQGKIWFTETSQGKIGYINSENELVEFIPDIPLLAPEALLFDEDKTVWVSEHTGNAITKFDPILETFSSIQVNNEEALPYGMSFDRYGNVWIAQHTVDSMAVYDPVHDTMIEIPIPTATSFVQFSTVDSQDNVWIVEQQANKLAMIELVELPPIPVTLPVQKLDIKYTEIASPLIAMGIVATSLFFVKNIRDKRRLNELIIK